MELTVWGCRGSYPEPGADTVKYGGNTSCYALKTSAGLIILDAGNGLIRLGRDLIKDAVAKRRSPTGINAKVLVSHGHVDHRSGWSFFGPAYIPGNSFSVYGPAKVVTAISKTRSHGEHGKPGTETFVRSRRRNSVEVFLSANTISDGHPVDLKDQIARGATLDMFDLEGKVTADKIYDPSFGQVVVEFIHGNHLTSSLMYKITDGGVSVVYTGDYEHGNLLLKSEHPLFHPEKPVVFDSFFIDFLVGADVVIADSQYGPHDYPKKTGWGHTMAEEALRHVAKAAHKSGKRIHTILTHHEPENTDAFLDKREWDLEQFVARENLFHHITWELARDGMVREIKSQG